MPLHLIVFEVMDCLIDALIIDSHDCWVQNEVSVLKFNCRLVIWIFGRQKLTYFKRVSTICDKLLAHQEDVK